MFADFRRRIVRVPPNDFVYVGQQFWVPQKSLLVKSFTSGVCENDSEKSFTVSYLVNSCGLSSAEADSVSKKVSIISPIKTDAVLKLLREYGFTDAHIPRLIRGWPSVLLANKLKPKLEFFRSIGVPLPILAQKLSLHPSVLTRSLDKSLVPLYTFLRNLLKSDERVVHVFTRAPKAFGWCWSGGISSNISILRERGVPESSIVKLFMYKPGLFTVSEGKLTGYIDRAVEMGFDYSQGGFIHALRVFVEMTESTLEHKMEVYRRCGWSESDIAAAFSRHPLCMSLSEKKITANMDFLVNKLGCKPAAIAQLPVILSYSLEKRIKPRYLVAKILEEKGLKNLNSVSALFNYPDEIFIKRFIVKYEKDVPELLDIYRGKMDLPRPE